MEKRIGLLTEVAGVGFCVSLSFDVAVEVSILLRVREFSRLRNSITFKFGVAYGMVLGGGLSLSVVVAEGKA